MAFGGDREMERLNLSLTGIVSFREDTYTEPST